MYLHEISAKKLKFGSFACTDNYWEDYIEYLDFIQERVGCAAFLSTSYAG